MNNLPMAMGGISDKLMSSMCTAKATGDQLQDINKSIREVKDAKWVSATKETIDKMCSYLNNGAKKCEGNGYGDEDPPFPKDYVKDIARRKVHDYVKEFSPADLIDYLTEYPDVKKTPAEIKREREDTAEEVKNKCDCPCHDAAKVKDENEVNEDENNDDIATALAGGIAIANSNMNKTMSGGVGGTPVLAVKGAIAGANMLGSVAKGAAGAASSVSEMTEKLEGPVEDAKGQLKAVATDATKQLETVATNAKGQGEQILTNAKGQGEQILTNAKGKGEQILSDAKEQAAETVAEVKDQAKQTVEDATEQLETTEVPSFGEMTEGIASVVKASKDEDNKEEDIQLTEDDLQSTDAEKIIEFWNAKVADMIDCKKQVHKRVERLCASIFRLGFQELTMSPIEHIENMEEFFEKHSNLGRERLNNERIDTYKTHLSLFNDLLDREEGIMGYVKVLSELYPYLLKAELFEDGPDAKKEVENYMKPIRDNKKLTDKEKEERENAVAKAVSLFPSNNLKNKIDRFKKIINAKDIGKPVKAEENDLNVLVDSLGVLGSGGKKKKRKHRKTKKIMSRRPVVNRTR